MKSTNNVWINETMFTKEQVDVFYDVLPEYEQETAEHDDLIAKRYGSKRMDVSPMTTIISCVLAVLVVVKMYI
jgi:hypothetical protein